MLVIEVMILWIDWQLIHVVKHQVLTALGDRGQSADVEEYAVVEQTTLRLLRDEKAKRAVPSIFEPLGHVFDESV